MENSVTGFDEPDFWVIAEALRNKPSEVDGLLGKMPNEVKYKFFISKHQKLPTDIVDKLVLTLPRRSQVNALKTLSDCEGATALKVYDCIIRGEDRDSLEPEKLYTHKILQAALQGYKKWKDSDRIKLHFSNKAVEDEIDMNDLFENLDKLPREKDISVMMAPFKFSSVEYCGDEPQWHLMLFNLEKSSLYHFHFVSPRFCWKPRLPKEVEFYPRYWETKGSYESGLYVIQLAQSFMDNPDCDMSQTELPPLHLTNKDIIAFLRLDGNFYCPNKYCHESFDTKAERAMHESRCNFTVDKNGRTVLFSCQDMQLTVVKELLQKIPKTERDTFIMMKDQQGKTALHQCENVTMATLLVHSVSEDQRKNFIMSQDDQGKAAPLAKQLIDSLSELDRENSVVPKDDCGETMFKDPTEEPAGLLLKTDPSNREKGLDETHDNRDNNAGGKTEIQDQSRTLTIYHKGLQEYLKELSENLIKHSMANCKELPEYDNEIDYVQRPLLIVINSWLGDRHHSDASYSKNDGLYNPACMQASSTTFVSSDYSLMNHPDIAKSYSYRFGKNTLNCQSELMTSKRAPDERYQLSQLVDKHEKTKLDSVMDRKQA